MGIRLEQLPAALRKQVEDKLDKPAKKRTTQRGSSVVCDARCECGEPFTSVTLWERHSDAQGAGHRRLDCLPSIAPRSLP